MFQRQRCTRLEVPRTNGKVLRTHWPLENNQTHATTVMSSPREKCRLAVTFAEMCRKQPAVPMEGSTDCGQRLPHVMARLAQHVAELSACKAGKFRARLRLSPAPRRRMWKHHTPLPLCHKGSNTSWVHWCKIAAISQELGSDNLDSANQYSSVCWSPSPKRPEHTWLNSSTLSAMIPAASSGDPFATPMPPKRLFRYILHCATTPSPTVVLITIEIQQCETT